MKKIQYLILGALAMLVYSCSNNKEFVPTYKGQIDGGDWIGGNTIGNYIGVTGEHCSKVDSINQYSWGFSKLIGEISSDPIKKVKVSVWVKLENLDKKSVLVISLFNKDKTIFWSGHDLNPVVKEVNKWYKFEIEESFPDYNYDETSVGVYVFNPNKNVAYVDDFEISFPIE